MLTSKGYASMSPHLTRAAQLYTYSAGAIGEPALLPAQMHTCRYTASGVYKKAGHAHALS